MPTAIGPVRHFRMPKSLGETLQDPAQAQPSTDSGRSLDKARASENEYTKDQKEPLAREQLKPKPGITFAHQDKLPKLPIPELKDTLRGYVDALKPFQSPREQSDTRQAVEDFEKTDGPELQERLKKYATGKTSYIEQFCMKSEIEACNLTDQMNRV
jgi:carnitine O-acetyltransferase